VYCRKLFPDLQIISRANSEKNVGTLHRAGADFVMSYASMGSSIILNILRGEDLVMFAEGLSVMRVKVPEDAEPHTVFDSKIREETGSNVIAVKHGEQTVVNPRPDEPITPGDVVVLAGNPEAETQVARLLGEKAEKPKT
jgi:voltage-gated potassium channel